jgi:hypothetical protein
MAVLLVQKLYKYRKKKNKMENDYQETLRDSIITLVKRGSIMIGELDPFDFGYDDIGSGLFNPDTEMTWEQFLFNEFGY